MDINDAIFNSVKGYMGHVDGISGGDDILIKICTGTATEEEKNKWQEEVGVTDEVTNKLKEYCDIGYNMASKLDTKMETKVEPKDKIEELTQEVYRLKIRVEHLENAADKKTEKLVHIYQNNL